MVAQQVARPPSRAEGGGSSPTPRLHRADWRVLPIEHHSDASRLIRCWHYSKSTPNTSTYRFGLWPTGYQWGDPSGVSMWLPPTKPAAVAVAGDGWGGVLALTRLAIEPTMPKNAASFLLSWSMKMIDRERWPVLLTYADKALGHTGAIYTASGWDCDGEVKAGDVWIGPHGERRGRKRGGRNWSADEMRAMGFSRARPANKIRFTHRLVDGDTLAAEVEEALHE